MLTVIAPNVVKAVDTLSWYSSDRDLNNGETVTGYQRVIVTSSTRYTNRYIARWCIYLDGQPISGISYQSDFKTPEPGLSSPAQIYYGRGVVSRNAVNQTSEGCWNTISEDQSFGFDITLNTTTWSNASHDFVIEATADDNTTHTKSVTVTSANVEPTVQWTTTAPVSAADTIALTARITPSANRIVKICLARDGSTIEASELTRFTGDTRYGGSPGGPGGTFGSAVGGCDIFEWSQGSWPPGLSIVTNLSISLKTATWAEIPTKITLTIFESIGRSYSTDLVFDPSLPLPLLAVNENSGSTWKLNASLKTTFSSSGADVNQICATLDGSTNSALEVSDCLVGSAAKAFASKGTFSLQTSQITNGSHTLRIVATDRFGRTGTSTFQFSVDNKPVLSVYKKDLSALREAAELTTTFSTSGSDVSEVCASIDGVQTAVVQVNGCSTGNAARIFITSGVITLRTHLLENGSHTLNLTTTDVDGRKGASTFEFVSDNTKPLLAPTGVSSGSTINGRISITPNGSISPLMRSAKIADVCVIGPSTASTCGNTQHNVNTACYPQGEHDISIAATDSYGLSTTNKYQVTTANPLPAIATLKAKTNEPAWSDNSISGEVTFKQSYGCSYKIQLSASNHKSVTYSGTPSSDSVIKRLSNLKPSTKYIAKITVIAQRGLRIKSISFITPAIPPRPKINNTNNSSGQYIPNVEGKRLDLALAYLENKGFTASYSYARNCSDYGLRAGLFGIQDFANWVVVMQSGRNLYACKYR